MGPQAAYRKGGLQGVRGDLGKQRALRLHTFCTTAVKTTPEVQAKQTGLATFGGSNTCQASCLSKVCVSFHLWLSWLRAWSHQEHVIPCNCAPAPGAGALGASPSMQVVCISTFLRRLLASLPHLQVLWAQLHPPELDMPQTLYGACEIHISALICLSNCATGLSEVLTVLELISNSQCLSAVCPLIRKSHRCSERVCCQG